MTRVIYAQAMYDEAEIAAVTKVLRDHPEELMNGARVRDFEAAVAGLFGKRHGVMVNSGSSANLLAVTALRLAEGAEVITPALTFSTTISPLLQLGLVPAVVDVEPGTFNIDAEAVAEMVSPATRALLIPNLIGNLPDWQTLRRIADEHGLAVIEDSADTLGAQVAGGPSGRFSHVSTTSFYASHVVTAAGFGGMSCTDDDVIADRMRQLRGWGRRSSLFQESEAVTDRFGMEVDGIPYDAKFVFDEVGYNLLPSELSAAFGLVQLDRLEAFTARRVHNFGRLRAFFAEYDHWFTLPRQRAEVATPWLAFAMVVNDDAPFTRRQLQMHFEHAGVQTRPVFTGNVLRQPGFRDAPVRKPPNGLPETDAVMRGGILLGCHQGIDDVQLDHMCATFAEFVSRF
jgi:CDP-6-deoxy-D-xylo-4-hexulose-3-dehydrase